MFAFSVLSVYDQLEKYVFFARFCLSIHDIEVCKLDEDEHLQNKTYFYNQLY